ncbi:MAG: DUF2474 domain-containing protein [Alphaproteobacteria bacterium]|nr:MAG: DUF2474 domain-containing protein [Alphaproteobacteria bacterium]
MAGPSEEGDHKPLGQKLLWFVALWLGGVAVVAGAGYAIRLVLMP